MPCAAEHSEQEDEDDEAEEQQQEEEVEDEADVTKRITKWRVPKMKDYLKNHSLDSEGLKAALCQRIVACMLHPTAADADASEAGDSAADDDGEDDDGDDDLDAEQVVRAEVAAMKSKDVESSVPVSLSSVSWN